MRVTGALVCQPDHYRVATSRNPHTVRPDGSLRTVDPARAAEQWQGFVAALKGIGLDVVAVDGDPELPDQVFTANPVFTGWRDGPAFVESRMTYPERGGEVGILAGRLLELGYSRLDWSDSGPLEGGGDLVWFGDGVILGGHGFRSTRSGVLAAGAAFGVDVLPLELIDPAYYHLDTCLCVLDATTALWVPNAFSPEARASLQRVVPRLLEVPAEEQASLAANAWCPDGRHVVLDAAWSRTARLVEDLGLEPVTVDLSEFSKAGGNVFCMKQALFSE